MVIQSRKDEFLKNAANKQRFINLLSDKLQKAGCRTEQVMQMVTLMCSLSKQLLHLPERKTLY
jgi:hypothetical protein